MKYFKNLCLVLCAFIIASNAYALESKKLDMFDKGRDRNVPVVIYQGDTINMVPLMSRQRHWHNTP
jgi:hypothetical protein